MFYNYTTCFGLTQNSHILQRKFTASRFQTVDEEWSDGSEC